MKIVVYPIHGNPVRLKRDITDFETLWEALNALSSAWWWTNQSGIRFVKINCFTVECQPDFKRILKEVWEEKVK